METTITSWIGLGLELEGHFHIDGVDTSGGHNLIFGFVVSTQISLIPLRIDDRAAIEARE